MKEYNINELMPYVRSNIGDENLDVSPLEITIKENQPMCQDPRGTVGFIVPLNIVQVAAESHNSDEMMRKIAEDIESGTNYEVVYLAGPKEAE